MVMKNVADKDLERHKAVVKKLFDFEWCDFCSGDVGDHSQASTNGDKKGAKPLCLKGCGPKFVKLCMPAIITFGKKEPEIKHLKEQLNIIELQIQEYKEM